MGKEQLEISKERNDPFGKYIDKKEHKSIAEQAQDLLDGNAKWSPTWQDLALERQRLLGDTKRTGKTRSGRLMMGVPPDTKPSEPSTALGR